MCVFVGVWQLPEGKFARCSESTAGGFFFGREEQVRDEKREPARCTRMSTESRLYTHQFTHQCVSGTGAGRKAALWGQCALLFFSHKGGKKKCSE